MVEQNFDWAGTPEQWQDRSAQRQRRAEDASARFFHLPAWANPDVDTRIGEDELGNTRFISRANNTEYILPRMQTTQRGSFLRGVYEAIPPMEDWRLPTSEELGAAAQFIGDAAYHVLSTPTNPDATLADVWDVAGTAMTGSLAGTVPQGALRSGAARSQQDSRIPLYRERTPEREPTTIGTAPQESGPSTLMELIEWEFFSDPRTGQPLRPPSDEWSLINYYALDSYFDSDELPVEALRRFGVPETNENIDFLLSLQDNPQIEQTIRGINAADNAYAQGIQNRQQPLATFRSPVLESLDSLQIPKNGIRGADVVKYLQNHPDIRSSELRSLNLDIDPQRRYSEQELRQIVEPSLWQVTAERAGRQYSTYQRQPIADPEIDYEEIIVRGRRRGDLPTYQGNSGSHHSEGTMAHARVSIRQPNPEGSSSPDNRPYILVEELQSDLVQKGFQKPSSTTTLPPITNNREFTRTLVEGILAYAQQNNVSEVVFPPFERIVAQRFNVGTEAYEKAMQPSSGFYRTYVTALNDVIAELQEQFGHNMIRVGTRELPYNTGSNNQGVSLDLGPTLSEYDLSRPRFYKGGLVTPNQKAFGELL